MIVKKLRRGEKTVKKLTRSGLEKRICNKMRYGLGTIRYTKEEGMEEMRKIISILREEEKRTGKDALEIFNELDANLKIMENPNNFGKLFYCPVLKRTISEWGCAGKAYIQIEGCSNKCRILNENNIQHIVPFSIVVGRALNRIKKLRRK